jgi:uncharacterized protein
MKPPTPKGVGFQSPGRSPGLSQVWPVTTFPALRPFWSGFRAMRCDAKVRRFYDALDRGDVPTVLSLLDPQVEWTEAERFPYYGGTWAGPQAVLDNLLVPLSNDWDGLSAKAHEFIAKGDRLVSLGTYSGAFRKTGRSFRPPSPTSGWGGTTSQRGSICTPTPPRCSKRCRAENSPKPAH